jgi:hypothetical protein
MVGKEDFLVIHIVFDMVETKVDREANEENEYTTDQLMKPSLDSLSSLMFVLFANVLDDRMHSVEHIELVVQHRTYPKRVDIEHR